MSCSDCEPQDIVIVKETEVERVNTLLKQEEYGVNFAASDLLVAAPPAPKQLVVSEILSDTSIALDWEDLANSYNTLNTNFDSYTVYVKHVATDTIVQTITGIQLSEADVFGLNEFEEYEFWVTATRGEAESDESNHVFATPEQQQPDAPQNFNVEVLQASYLIFNGTDQHVDIGGLSTFSSQEISDGFTIEMRLSSLHTAGATLLSLEDGGEFGTLAFLRINRITGSNVIGHIDFFIRDESNDILRAHTTNPVLNNDGTPYSLAIRCTPSSNSIEFLINGNSVAVTYDNINAISNFNDFIHGTLGVMVDETGATAGMNHNGGIDEVRFWNNLRSDTEISNNHNTELFAPNGWATDYPNLYRYYKANDGSGDQLTEEVVNDHGTLQNNVNDNMWGEGNL